MALETFDNQIDIKDLSLDIPERDPDSVFVADREFSAKDRQAIIDKVHSLNRSSLKCVEYLSLAADFVLVFPQHAQELKLDQDFRTDIANELLNAENACIHEKAGPYKETAELLELIAHKRTAVPDVVIQFSSFVKPNIEKLIGNHLSEVGTVYDFNNLVNHRIVFPEENLEIQPQLLEDAITFAKESLRLQEYVEFAKWAAGLKIISPHSLAEIPLSNEDWQSMITALRLLKIEDPLDEFNDEMPWSDIMQYAKNLQILMANKINIDDSGIHLELPAIANSPVNVNQDRNLPNQRKF